MSIIDVFKCPDMAHCVWGKSCPTAPGYLYTRILDVISYNAPSVPGRSTWCAWNVQGLQRLAKINSSARASAS